MKVFTITIIIVVTLLLLLSLLLLLLLLCIIISIATNRSLGLSCLKRLKLFQLPRTFLKISPIQLILAKQLGDYGFYPSTLDVTLTDLYQRIYNFGSIFFSHIFITFVLHDFYTSPDLRHTFLWRVLRKNEYNFFSFIRRQNGFGVDKCRYISKSRSCLH